MISTLTFQVVHLATAFPNLQKLDVAVNPLSTKKSERTTSPNLCNISELVVGDCGISAWDDVVDMFGWMPSYVYQALFS
jgi:hypothetical protein